MSGNKEIKAGKCPFKALQEDSNAQFDPTLCDMGACAWWCDHHHRCSIVSIAKFLDAIDTRDTNVTMVEGL